MVSSGVLQPEERSCTVVWCYCSGYFCMQTYRQAEVGAVFLALFWLAAQIRFLAYPECFLIDFKEVLTGQTMQFFAKISPKPNLEVIWNAVPIRPLQMCLSPGLKVPFAQWDPQQWRHVPLETTQGTTVRELSCWNKLFAPRLDSLIGCITISQGQGMMLTSFLHQPVQICR